MFKGGVAIIFFSGQPSFNLLAFKFHNISFYLETLQGILKQQYVTFFGQEHPVVWVTNYHYVNILPKYSQEFNHTNFYPYDTGLPWIKNTSFTLSILDLKYFDAPLPRHVLGAIRSSWEITWLLKIYFVVSELCLKCLVHHYVCLSGFIVLSNR